MLCCILFSIFAWAFIGAISLGILYWVGVFFVCIYHFIKGTPSTGNGAADVIDNYLGYSKTHNVRIDIFTDKDENDSM